MTDLSADGSQSVFRKVQRVGVLSSALMAVLSVVNAGLAIWVLTENSKIKTSILGWTEILLIVIAGIILVLAIAFLVIKIKLHKPYREIIDNFVAESFEGNALLEDGVEVELELLLAGDKLVLFRTGREGVVQLDLSPVKNFTGVCAAIRDNVKNYVRAYYFLHPAEKVVLYDGIAKKSYDVTQNGVPAKDCSKSYFIKSGLIK